MGRTKPRCTRSGSEYSVGAVESGGSLGCSDRAFRLGGPHHGPAVRHVTFDITALAAGTLDPSSGGMHGAEVCTQFGLRVVGKSQQGWTEVLSG